MQPLTVSTKNNLLLLNISSAILIGGVVSGVAFSQGASYTKSALTGLVASTAFAVFITIDTLYKDEFAPSLERIIHLNRSIQILYNPPSWVEKQLAANPEKEKKFTEAVNEYSAKTRTEIKQLYGEIFSIYPVLKSIGWISRKDIQIFEQLKHTEGHFYEKIREKMGVIRDHRIVKDPTLIYAKLAKQLACAENHRASQNSPCFNYLKVPEKMTKTESSYYCLGFVSSENQVKTFNDLKSSVGDATVQGVRESQEDASIATSFDITTPNGQKHTLMLSGVFDGHGSPRASSFMKKNLAEKLRKTFQDLLGKNLPETSPLKELEGEETLTDLIIWNVLKITCVELSNEIKKIESESRAGTTATFSLLKDGKDLFHVNVGDSRSFIASKRKTIQLSEDASLPNDLVLSNEVLEKKKSDRNSYEIDVLKRGGYIFNGRVNGHLNMARAIGDNHLNEAICSRPKITKVSLLEKFPNDECCFLVQACDGLWDGVSTDQVAKVVCEDETGDPHQIARNLVYSAAVGNPSDNISIVITRIDLKFLK